MEREGVRQKRDPYPDILKGIAIILVVLGHCIQFGSGRIYEGSGTFQSNPLFIWIYSFHMPLFMLIAGYFTAGSLERYSWKECLVHRIQSLVIPIFSWSVLYEIYVWSSAVLNSGVPAWRELPGTWLLYFFSSQWFLWAVFLYTVIVTVGGCLGQYSMLLFVLLYLCTCWIDVPGNFCNLNTYITNWPLFLTGYLVGISKRKRKEKSHGWLEKPAVMVPCFLLYVLFLVRQLTESLQISLLSYRIHYIMIGISGSVTVAAAVWFWYDKTAGHAHGFDKVWNGLSFLGRKTMGIYLITGYLCTEVLRKVPADGFHVKMVLLETVGIMLVSLAVIVVIERIPMGGKCLLGEKAGK